MKIRLNEKYDRVEIAFSGGTPDDDDNLNPIELPREGKAKADGPVILLVDQKNYIREIQIPGLREFFKGLTGAELPKFPETN